MGICLEEKEELNYQAFITELEKISKKYGIAFESVGGFAFSDENGFKNIRYSRDSYSGDLLIKELTFSDGTKSDR